MPFKSSSLIGVLEFSESDLKISFDISPYSLTRLKIFLFPIRLFGKSDDFKNITNDYKMIQVFYSL